MSSSLNFQIIFFLTILMLVTSLNSGCLGYANLVLAITNGYPLRAEERYRYWNLLLSYLSNKCSLVENKLQTAVAVLLGIDIESKE